MGSPSVTHTPAGFEVTRTADSTIFHRVPIFAECTRGELVFDAAWIEKAVAEAKAGERDGHLPPLHTRHHEPATDQTNGVRSAGVFRVLGAAPLTFKGKRVTAIYADLIITDPLIAGEVERMRYPYRSVEIFSPDGPPKINGLALLDHEAPYLELPMLMAGAVTDKSAWPTGPDGGVASATFAMDFSSQPGDLVVGSVRRDSRAYLLFSFDGADPMTNKTKTPAELEAEKVAAAAKAAANFADDEKKGDDDKEHMEGDEGGGIDVAGVAKAIESGEISVADMDMLLAAIQSQKGGVEEEPEEEPEAAPAPAPGAEIMKAGKDSLNFARLSGELEALKAKDAARDQADLRRDEVAAAMAKLDGKVVGSNIEARLINFHTKSNGGELFKEYVDTMASTAGDLPHDGDVGATFAAQHGKTPALAMKYQSVSSEAVDRAAHFCREYETIKGHGMRASRESYVATQLKREGIVLEEAVA